MEFACPYNGCRLPENNNRFFWQGAYVLAAVLLLLFKRECVSFFPIFTFIMPLLIDLANGKTDQKISEFFRKAFLIFDVGLIIFCLLGWQDLMVDVGDAFMVSANSVIWPGIEFSKSFMIIPLVAQIGVPTLYRIVSPTKLKCVMENLVVESFTQIEAEAGK